MLMIKDVGQPVSTWDIRWCQMPENEFWHIENVIAVRVNSRLVSAEIFNFIVKQWPKKALGDNNVLFQIYSCFDSVD